ncbi:MAG: asparaginase [Cytophagales bacterium]|nr:asparaginase [Bernardetiaceae bacterium]MDW8211078.1 asparaginase [Cytophagales bacterium]
MLNYYQTINISTAAGHIADTAIFVIYTGGTIGMDYDKEGKHLKPINFEHIIEKVPELRRFEFELTLLSFENPIDSADIKVHHWINIARIVYDFYNDYDAFVILHGTDTMAYTASALSFLFENLAKPVILTGAQLPIGVPRTDARENFITALEIAAMKKNGSPLVPEVCILFDNLLLRGNRARKVQSNNFTAFASENFPPLAITGIEIRFNESLILPTPTGRFDIFSKMDENVGLLKIFPGISRKYLEHFLATPDLRGIVMETYGSGNTPADSWFMNALSQAIENGIHILNVSQCNGGTVIHGMYESSKILESIGVISGGDITPEAAIAKMMFLLANEPNPQLVRQKLATSLRGEMTYRQSKK